MESHEIIERRTISSPISIPTLIFGILWVGLMLRVIFGIGLSYLLGSTVFIPLFIFFLVGIYILYRALSSKQEETIEVSTRDVQFSRKNWYGKESGYTEPISSFSGLMLVPREVSTGDDHTRTVFDIDLIHKEKDLHIILQTFSDNTATREQIEYYAKRLKVPILEKDVEGNIIERKVEELDDTLSERLIKGKFQRTFASNAPFKSKKYRLIETSGGIILDRPYRGVLYIGISMILGAIFLMIKGILPLGFDLALLMCGGFMTFGGITREQLEIKDGLIIYRTLILKYEFSATILRMSEVEEISTRNNPKYGNVNSMNQAIRISTDKAEVFFAQYTPKAEREWIIDKLIELTLKQS